MTAIKKLVNFCIETPPYQLSIGASNIHIDKVSLNDIILVEVVNFCN